VIVATIRALKMHGGVTLDALTVPDPSAVTRGLDNLAAHLDAARHFRKPTLVAINQFGTDSPEELRVVHEFCEQYGVGCSTANVFAEGGEGAIDLARKVVAAADAPDAPLQPLYPLEWSIERKIERIASAIYGADGVSFLPAAEARSARPASSATASLPVCMAKTQDSLSDNPKLRGRPRGFTVTVRDLEIAAGAGFVVA
jgi:formate--tetrahydrofolate ligase